MGALTATTDGDLDRTRSGKQALLRAHGDVHRAAMRQPDTGCRKGFGAIGEAKASGYWLRIDVNQDKDVAGGRQLTANGNRYQRTVFCKLGQLQRDLCA